MPHKSKKNDDSADDLSLRSVIDATNADLMKELKNINGSLQILQSKICQVEGTLQKVLETQKTQDAEIKALKEDVIKMKENYDNVFAEFESRDRRKNNLILSGIPESENGTADERKEKDLSTVKSLFFALDWTNIDAVSTVYRIGKMNPSRPRLLKVICASAESKRSLLSKSKNLRNVTQYKNVYMNPDLTPLQQVQNKQLREELRRRRDLGEDVKIQRGSLVASKAPGQNFR